MLKTDPRDPLMTVHKPRTMLAQRIFSNVPSYENLSDQQALRTDAAVQVAAGVANGRRTDGVTFAALPA